MQKFPKNVCEIFTNEEINKKPRGQSKPRGKII